MSNSFDEAYWTARYHTQQTSWDVGSISTPVKEYIDQLQDKNISILIPGAGNAYEAEYLHHKGFRNVTVLDLSKEPLKNIAERVPEFPASRLIQGDFFEHEGSYDLIIEQTFFCALSRSLRSAYVKKMQSLLKPQGKLTGVLFNSEFDKDGPPFGGSQQEYISLFEPYFKLSKLENCYNSIKPRAGREFFLIFQKPENLS